MTAMKTAFMNNGEINNPKIIHLCVEGMWAHMCAHLCMCVLNAQEQENKITLFGKLTSFQYNM